MITAMVPTVRAEDFSTWSDRFEAAAILPELVRRLLLATAAPLRLEMRTDGGVRLPGVDGILAVRSAGPFWPLGSSIWELSVRNDVGRKADADYQKRTDEIPSGSRSSLAFVFLTARRWARKAEWIEAKRAEQVWADVRALDADDLATWLTEAPAVGLWFANTQLGRPTDDEVDIGSYMETWVHRTQPPLPAALPLVGREEAFASLLGWWSSPRAIAGESLVVADDTRDEALAFIAAATAKIPDAHSRCIVVLSERAFRWNAKYADLVVVPAYGPPALPPNGPRIILPVTRQEVRDKSAIVLERPRREEIVLLLADENVLSPEIGSKLVQEAGGSISALQRLLGYVQKPHWAEGASAEMLQTFVLLGAWVPRSEADRSAVRGMGVDPDRLEYECATLVDAEDPPIVRRGEVFAWRARGDSWAMFVPAFSPGLLARFERTATEVLERDDPKFDLDASQRPYAHVLGKISACSEALREGTADGVLRLATSDAKLRKVAGVRSGSSFATRVVRHVLVGEWKRWASLNSILPVLAEASPAAFIERLRESIEMERGGIGELLSQITAWSNPFTGVLWALERIAWLPEYVDAVVDLLAELALRDRVKHNWVNRPENSLKHMLLAWIPQSATSVDDRIRLLHHLAQRWPDVSWEIVVSHFDQFGMLTTTPRPAYRSVNDPGESSAADVMRQMAAARVHALTLAANRADRWVKLLEMSSSDNELRELVLAEIVSNGLRVDDPVRLWNAVRHQIYLAHLTKAQGERAELPRLNIAYEVLTPQDPVERVRWLFRGFAELPDDTAGDYHRQEARARELRQQAVAALHSLEDGWSRIASLGAYGAYGAHSLVAESLIDAKLGPQTAERFLDATFGPQLGHVGALTAAMLGTSLEPAWLDRSIAMLLTQGRTEDAILVSLGVPSGIVHWDRLDRLGEPVKSEYWRRVRIPAGKSKGDTERAAREMLGVGRPVGAVDVLSWATEQVAPDLSLDALEALANWLRGPSQREERLDAYEVQQLIRRLDADPSADEERLVRVQLSFLGAFHEYEPGARLYRVIADNPDQFVALVAMSYRADEEPVTDLTEQQVRAAEGAHAVLQSWKGYPAYGQPAVDRERALESWSEQCIARLRELRRTRIAGIVVGAVLARVATAEDGMWPCVAARNLLERGGVPTLADGLSIAKRNLRGVVKKSIGEGGRQEHVIANGYRAGAEKLKAHYPRTAELLRRLGDSYQAEAEREDERGEIDRDRYDLGPPPRGQSVSEDGRPIEVSSSFEARLRSLVEEKRGDDVNTDWNQEREIWLGELDALFVEVGRWVSGLVAKELLSCRATAWKLTEERLGDYKAPGLELVAGNSIVVLEPVGTLIVGARGRVDMYRQGRRERSVMLVLVSAGIWEAWITRATRKPLSAEVFEELVNGLL